MKNNLTIRQGNSYIFVGELKDDNGNVLQLSDYDTITILVTSPHNRNFIFVGENLPVEDNKVIFRLSGTQTSLLSGQVHVEAKLTKGTDTIIGLPLQILQTEHSFISKI